MHLDFSDVIIPDLSKLPYDVVYINLIEMEIKSNLFPLYAMYNLISKK